VCGRYTLAVPDPAQIRARFSVGETVDIRRRYNIAPGDDVLALTAGRDGIHRGELLRWGLVPAWAQGPAIGLRLINARAETVADKPAFRAAFAHTRCLIVADGFYEWGRAETGRKQAFHITLAAHEPFAFAGLWSVWHGDRDPQKPAPREPIRSCSIITMAAGGAIASLHDRMPVILPRDAEEVWLRGSVSAAQLADLLARSPVAGAELRPVGAAVNDARYDGPECLADRAPESQTALF
jgi:putative SOS response-associated peptidase YedK